MPRKTRKQKLQHQLRVARAVTAIQHQFIEQGGVQAHVDNEIPRVQAAALAHGVIATLAEAKKTLGEEEPKYVALDATMKGRIAQCYVTLMQTGLSNEEATARIMRGH